MNMQPGKGRRMCNGLRKLCKGRKSMRKGAKEAAQMAKEVAQNETKARRHTEAQAREFQRHIEILKSQKPLTGIPVHFQHQLSLLLPFAHLAFTYIPCLPYNLLLALHIFSSLPLFKNVLSLWLISFSIAHLYILCPQSKVPRSPSK